MELYSKTNRCSALKYQYVEFKNRTPKTRTVPEILTLALHFPAVELKPLYSLYYCLLWIYKGNVDVVSFLATGDMKKRLYFTSGESTERRRVLSDFSSLAQDSKTVCEHYGSFCSVKTLMHVWTNLTVSHCLLNSLSQGTCTWTRDRAFPLWWAHQDTLTYLPWATRLPPWQVIVQAWIGREVRLEMYCIEIHCVLCMQVTSVWKYQNVASVLLIDGNSI